MSGPPDYTPHASRGGSYRQIPKSTRARNPYNERDLGLALRARIKLGQMLGAQRVHGQDTTLTAQGYMIVKSIVWQLQASTRQREVLRKVLGLAELPPVRDPIPAAAKVLPLKPPNLTRTGTDD